MPCDPLSQAVRINIALATFSLKSSDFCTSFILVFALKTSGWAGSTWVPVGVLATAASPHKLHYVSVQRQQSGGGTAHRAPQLHEQTVKLCDAHLTDLVRHLVHFVVPTAKHQGANFKDCKFRVIVAKPTVLLCGLSLREGARGLCKLAEHLAWEGLWSEFSHLQIVRASVNSEHMPACGTEPVWAGFGWALMMRWSRWVSLWGTQQPKWW